MKPSELNACPSMRGSRNARSAGIRRGTLLRTFPLEDAMKKRILWIAGVAVVVIVVLVFVLGGRNGGRNGGNA